MKGDIVQRSLLDRAARRFRILGDPVRLEILNFLHGKEEMNVQEIVEATGQGQANVSKHLRVLAEEGLVRRRKERTFVYYSIDDPSLSGLCLLVCGQLQHVTE